MSYVKNEKFLEKINKARSLKSFAQNFLLNKMAGQKIFLFNKTLPRVINISFNEKTCMFSCRICPYSDKKVRKQYSSGTLMTFNSLKQIVKSIPNDSYYSFDISSIGETLEFKPLPEFIAYIKHQKPMANAIISTNGLLLTEELFLKLAESGLDSIQLSFFAENAADHKFITGTKTFEKVKNRLEAVCRLKKEKGLKKPFMQTFVIESQENKHTTKRFVDYWSQFVDKAFVRPMYNVGREIEGMTPIFKKNPQESRYPCITPWYATAIRSNGDVLPCYMYHWHEEGWSQIVGNINEQSLREIWSSKIFQKFRNDHLQINLEDYPICCRCDLWNAYINIWKLRDDGGFVYDKISVKDFITPSPEYRGG